MRRARAKSMNSMTSIRRSPISILAMTVCEVLSRFASSCCESPAAFRAATNVAQSVRCRRLRSAFKQTPNWFEIF